MLYFRCKEAIMLWMFLQSRCFRKCACCVNIAPLHQNILLFKCLSVSMLSAGVRGVGCTLCSIFQRNPGSAVAYYHFIPHQLRHMVGKQWLILKYGHFSNHYVGKKTICNCIWNSLRTLWCNRGAVIKRWSGSKNVARISPDTLFEQHLLWANRWSSSVLIK